MRKSKLHERLVLDPKKVKEEFDRSPGLEKHVDFGLQIDIDHRNGRSQAILYDCLLMFLTHLFLNYVPLDQSKEEVKDKFVFLLPKKAFREYVNQILKSYRYSDVEKGLLALSQNKVVTEPGTIVPLFTLAIFKGFEDFWGIMIHQTTAPYICGPVMMVMLNMQRIIPFIPSGTLSLDQMVEEREKAGLNVPMMMNIINHSTFVME